MIRLAAVALAAGLALTGCVSTPSQAPTDRPSPTSDTDYAAAVQENWGDCLASLEATGELVFTPGGDGTLQAGFVTTDYSGGTLSWNVGLSNTNNVITIPTDQVTTDALATVGC